MTLKDANKKQTYILESFSNDMSLELYNKLISMGLGVGTIIIIAETSFPGLSMFYVDNKKICLRSKDAKHVKVGIYNE